MADKVTLRFEQFDANADGDILVAGPISLDKTVNTVAELEDLVYRGTSGPVLPTSTTIGNYFLLVPTTGSIAIKIATSSSAFGNPTSLPEQLVFYSTNVEKYYELSNTTWSEKPVQDVVVYVRNVFDAVAPEVVQDLKFRGAYFYYRELTASWQEVLLGTHTHENKGFLDKLDAVDITGAVGTKKFFTLEITDTDDSLATYEYNINWEDLPESLPAVPEGSESLYLGHDEDGNPEWKNNFVAAQAFQVKNISVTSTGTSVSIPDVVFDPDLDEVLVLVGKFFVYNRTLSYNSTTDALTITLISDAGTTGEVASFESGETVTAIVIRNGAAAILDTLATDYVTKEEAITLLSGGSVNLSDYARKADLRGYARKYHTHSQFARADHDHDYRYAMFNHTHAEYLTRKSALELIQQTLTGIDGEEVIETLIAVSEYLDNNSNVLATLATKTELAAIQTQIDEINDTLDISDTESPLRVQLDSYLDERTFESHQINTEFVDEGGTTKNLDQVLTELREDIEADLGNIDSSEVILEQDIPVLLSSGENQGDYVTGDTAEEGQTLTQLLTRLLQREITPTYTAGIMAATFSADISSPEIGEEVDLTVTSTFTRNDSGLLNSFTVTKEVDDVEETLHTGSSVVVVTEAIQALEELTVITVSGAYSAGGPKYNNIDTYYGRTSSAYEVPGKIAAGSTNSVTHTITGKRAVFFGGVSAVPTINSASIRSLFERDVPASLSSFEYEYEVPVGTRFILFALPDASGSLSEVEYAEQSGLDILAEFLTETVSVSGANGVSPANYKVYKLSLPNATAGQMTLTFRK
jgi:hypothetical protein